MTDVSAHTVKAFDDDLDQLRASVAEMGGCAEAALREATEALLERDSRAAEAVIARNARIDALGIEIERRTLCLLALRAPMADDLREVLAALKISVIIERIGAHAKKIAERVDLIEGRDLTEPLATLKAMSGHASALLKRSLDAFISWDGAAASGLRHSDPAINTLSQKLFAALLQKMTDQPRSIGTCSQLLFVAQTLERVGDHATNIASTVFYAATGERPGALRETSELTD